MAIEKITKKRTKDPVRDVTCDYDIPDTLDGMVEAWGKEQTHSAARAAVRVRAQSVIDGGIAKGLSDEQIQARLTSWKPGVSIEGGSIDPLSAFRLMNAEEKAAFLQALAEETA